jgi:hypothetical protein
VIDSFLLSAGEHSNCDAIDVPQSLRNRYFSAGSSVYYVLIGQYPFGIGLGLVLLEGGRRD